MTIETICRNAGAALAAALLTLILGAPAMAGPLQSLQADPPSTRVGSTVKLTVKAQGRCGVLFEPGDGRQLHRVVDRTRVFQIAYASEGTYTAKVRGKRKNDDPACQGSVPPVTVEVKPRLGIGRAGQTGVRPMKPATQKLTLGTTQDRPLNVRRKGKTKGTPPGATPPSDSSKPNLPEVNVPTCDEFPCIEAVRIDAAGTSAKFEVLATKQNAVKIEVGSSKPVGSKWSSQMSNPSGSAFTIQYRNPSITTVHDLEPGRDYWYLVRTQDEEGRHVFESGRFSTTGRKARVTLRRVFANDDGDEGGGAGDFRFSIEANGKEEIYASADISSGSGVVMSSTECHPTCTFTMDAAPESIQLGIGVYENDKTDYPTPGVWFGGRSDYTWVEDDLFLGTSGPESWSVDRRVSNGEFDVMVYIDVEVWYE